MTASVVRASRLAGMAKQVPGRRPYHPDDAGVRELLAQTPTPVGTAFVSQLVRADSTRLVSYGLRMVVLGMRELSLDRLREGLLAIAVGAAVRTGDDRDLMLVLAVPHVASGQLGVRPAEVFDATADRFEAGWLPELLRVFGARDDVTLEAFGWRQVATPDGIDVIS
jgi:hypothetical protein